jgi:hypothetical protein
MQWNDVIVSYQDPSHSHMHHLIYQKDDLYIVV